mgnify:CR=1 FL=1
MNVHARIKAPVAKNSLIAERGHRGCGLRLVDECDNTVEQSFYDVAVIGLGYVGLPLCLASVSYTHLKLPTTPYV